MFAVVEIVAPLFLLIVIGWLFTHRGWISADGVKGLMTFLVNLAIPALMFSAVYQAMRADGVDFALPFAYLLGALLNMALAAAIGRRLFGMRFDEAVVAGFGSTFGNLALLSVPVVTRAYGDEGLAAISLILTFHAPVLIGSASAVIEISHARGEGPWRAMLNLVGRLARNPIVLGVAAGGIWGGSGHDLPVILADMLALLRDSAPAAALFAVGATLVGFSIAGDLKQTIAFSALKLFVMPVIVGALVWWIADPSPAAFATAVTAAAMPAGVNAFLLARVFNIYERRASGVIFLSTLVSAGTLTLVIAWFLHAGAG